MSDRSCDCYSEDEDKKFCDSLFSAIIFGVKFTIITYTTSYLIDKTIKHSGEIKELFSRLGECEKYMYLHKIHELKK